MADGFNCFKCHHKCKAGCCGVSPIEKDIYQRNLDKRLRIIVEEEGLDSCIVPVTEDLKCTFLKEDFTCNIYDDRPKICKKFGDETHLMMTCVFQDKNGRERSRQERRGLQRKINGKQEYSVDYLIDLLNKF